MKAVAIAQASASAAGSSVVLDPLDIVLAEIAAGLRFDHLKIDR
jgi:hypothetical protein